ncbi:hypothetical protein Nepgr_002081 [Nepenthes gracilis]|uniref:DUF7870 domain-containing protein n=1 Tax=Nepenthes gracilis TaxID=150966 RepID=A0AAD3RWJ3_NEPGR|nr:hypothetical protein Nepgr_002081 [Nepenthes gracilis]
MTASKVAMELPFYTCQKIENNGKALHAAIIIRLSNCKVVKVLAQAIILASLIIAFPLLGGDFRQLSLKHSNGFNLKDEYSFNGEDLVFMPLLFRDLANEGIIKEGYKALVVGDNDDGSDALYSTIISATGNAELIARSDTDRQKFIDRTLKLGGIAAIKLGHDPSSAFKKALNYKIVYARSFSSAFIVMRKMALSQVQSPMQRKLLEFTDEEKKKALNRLEYVLLEPPRAASGKSRTYLKRIRYLPDLLNDSLESYPRRVYIDIGVEDGNRWFDKYYPTRNQDFEKYRIETVPDTGLEAPESAEGMSEWLRKTVKEEEYVVMKAEAEVVEELMKSKAILLVDELAVQGKSARAYWECLALYGRVRDLGVAVHQWWG